MNTFTGPINPAHDEAWLSWLHEGISDTRVLELEHTTELLPV